MDRRGAEAFAMIPDPADPHGLSRFVEAQERRHAAALEELKRGAKQGHWMWFIFPQVAGLGHSAMAQRYAIRSRQEAEAYLAHPVLGPRLTTCSEALLGITGRSAEQIMGFPDVLKLQSSMTFFAELSPPDSVFERAPRRFYGGDKDPKTVAFISRPASGSTAL